MHEASKTNSIRDPLFQTHYLQGRVIDIGCGEDLVCPGAEPFDRPHGDAQEITRLRENEAYDTVHSSHCLEHMRDPVVALDQWWALVKPGGYLIIIVPDEDLYEQGYWPSRFNHDHKATFRMEKPDSWSPVSHDIKKLIQRLPGAEIIEIKRQDSGFDYSLISHGETAKRKKPLLPLKLVGKCLRAILKPFPNRRRAATWALENHYFETYGIPVDQTSRDALAQIQVVATKRSDAV